MISLKISLTLVLLASLPSCGKRENISGDAERRTSPRATGNQGGQYREPIGPGPSAPSTDGGEASPDSAKYAGLEKTAMAEWPRNPTAALEQIKAIPYPAYVQADAATKKRIEDMARNVGEMNTLPVNQRLEYIFGKLPLNVTPGVADDMIRILGEKDLNETGSWLKQKGQSDAKTELYKLIVQRMKNLGMAEGKIKNWVDGLEYEEERSAALGELH